jgi:NADPH-dependent 2,4-dienoyl-CoA reductase/sulfur reductase-like enzyme
MLMARSDNSIDVAVIGSGPAGLAAAIAAREAGANNVTIFERAENPGGLLFQCIHNGFGLHKFKEDLTGPEYAHRFIERARDLKINMQLSTMVLDITPDKQIVASSSRDGLKNFKPGSIVLATGCRERTRQNLMIPGTRPAGVFTAGVAQRYVNIEGFMPGRKFVILGSGDVGMIMARRLSLEGAEVRAVIEILPYVGGLIRNEVQCIHDFNIPLLLEHTVTNIHGRDRVEAVTVARVDRNWQAISGTEKVIECDTLLLSVGLIPENELSLKAGIRLDPLVGGPIVNDRMETTVPGIFAGGNMVHVHDLVDNVSQEAEKAGAYAAEYALTKVKPSKRKINLRAGKNIRYIVPHSISGENEVTLYMRVKEPEDKVKLRVGNILRKSLRAVRPGEMVQVSLSQMELSKLPAAAGELVISCGGEE